MFKFLDKSQSIHLCFNLSVLRIKYGNSHGKKTPELSIKSSSNGGGSSACCCFVVVIACIYFEGYTNLLWNIGR